MPDNNLRRSTRKRTRTATFAASADSTDEKKRVSTRKTKRQTKTAKKKGSVAKVTTEQSPDVSKKTAPSRNGEEKIGAVKRESPARTKRTKKGSEASSFGAVRYLSSDLAAIRPENSWVDMKIAPEELRPSATLTTGQSFSWVVVEYVPDTNGRVCPADGAASGDEGSVESSSSTKNSAWGTHDATEWVGPLGNRVISIRETPTSTQFRVLHGSTDDVEAHLRDYFQLETPLASLYKEWAKHDERLARIAEVIPGVRILRQDPIECLFSFICSSNNNIPRIAKMLAAFRERYGNFLMSLPGRSEGGELIYRKIYSFPTLDALKAATDADLRKMGLGYRAKYIVQTRDLLIEAGGQDYLMDLRTKEADHVQDELIKFSGIGRKVADCIALFSLDQSEAIPVDVHVWHIACREYDPSLSSAKSLTPTIYKRVGELFRERFPSYAGWGHSLLFVAELPSFRAVLPRDIVAEMDEWREQEQEKKAAKKAEKAAKKNSA